MRQSYLMDILKKSINLLLLFVDLILTLKVIFMTKNNLIKLFTIIILFIIAGILQGTGNLI